MIRDGSIAWEITHRSQKKEIVYALNVNTNMKCYIGFCGLRHTLMDPKKRQCSSWSTVRLLHSWGVIILY